MSEASILLADDEEVFGQTTAELIRRAGYHCDVVVCVDGALARLEETRYDVLVADIMMPGSAQHDLLSTARQRFPDMQIILVTGFPSVETAVKSLDKGAFAYKIKPFDLDDFISTLGLAVKRSRLQRGMRHEVIRGEAIAQRLRELLAALDTGGASGGLSLTARQYIKVVMANVSESMLDALDVMALVDMPAADVPVRRLAQHPDSVVFREAIRETIAVLESTKTAFKSRELAELRRKLDVLMTVIDSP
ncbi:MAG: response regulator [bacterium]|nr:response regulator [bacterium]